MRYIAFVLSLLANISLFAFSFSEHALDILRLKYTSTFTAQEISMMEECAEADETFIPVLECLKDGKAFNLETEALVYDSLKRQLEKEGAESEESYRLTLYAVMSSRFCELNFPVFLRAVRNLKANIMEYVSDPELRRQWLMLVDCNIPDMMRADYSWSMSDANFRACQYVDEHGIGKDEIGLRLGINSIVTMAYGNYYANDIDGLYRNVRGIIADLYPNSIDLHNFVELQYTSARLATSPDDDSLYERNKNLVERCRAIPSDYFSELLLLSTREVFRGDSVAAAENESKARVILDSLAINAKFNSEVYNLYYAMAESQSICLAIARGNKAKAMAELKQVKHKYDSIATPQAWRAMMYVYDSMRILDLGKYEQDSIIADMYAYALKEPDAETRAIALIKVACAEGDRGRYDSASNMFELSREAARLSDSTESLLAAIDHADGYLLFETQQVDKAEKATLSALDYYVSHDLSECYIPIYGSLAWTYNLMGNSSMAVEYARKYWDGISRLDMVPYSSLLDYNVQRILIQEKPDPQARIDATKRLLKLAYDKGFGYICAYLHSDIAQNHVMLATPEAIDKAKEHYEIGFQLITEYGSGVADVQDYLIPFLNFLQQTGDKKRHNEIIAAVIADVENTGHDVNMVYFRILGNELILAVNNSNLMQVNYYMFKIFALLNRLTAQLQGDQQTLTMAGGILLPPVVYSASWFFREYAALKGSDISVEDFKAVMNSDWDVDGMIELFQSNYAETISDCDFNYTSLLSAKANWLIAKGDLTQASAVIDSLAMNPFYNYDGEIRNFFPGLRCMIAEKLGDYREVARLLELPEVKMSLDRAEWGMDINQVSNLFSRLVMSYHRQGLDENAMAIVIRRQNLVRDFIVNQYAGLPEHERYTLVDKGIVTPTDIYFMLQYYPSENARRIAYDATLMSRGILLESTNMQRRAILASGDSSLVADFYRMEEMKRELANTSNHSTPNSETYTAYHTLSSKIHELEADIMSRSASLSDLQLRRNADCKSVAKALKQNEAAIEFVAFCDYDRDNVWKFAALLLRRNMKAPEFIPLMDDQKFRTVIGNTKANAKTTIKHIYSYNFNGKILYHELWEPLEMYLDGVDRIYYTTSGNLSTLSFAALEDSTRTPLCQRYDLQQLTSTAQLCTERNKHRKSSKYDFVAVGDIDYDADSVKAQSRRGEWRHLDLSLAEINYVDSLCKEIPSIIFEKRQGLEPTEEYIRSLSGKAPNIMLMSTHGFFMNREAASKADFYINKGMTSDTIPNNVIPSLSRGGLVFANASPVWNNEVKAPNVSDGILTGMELAELDFSNTDLMVLSACQTGLGDCTITEGINGLQRALKLAGVKSMIVSLWVVNDKAGMEFMGHFYRHLFMSGGDRHKAFRDAQRDMQKQYPREPYLWAPFVMID